MQGESRGQLVVSIDLELLTRAGSLKHERQLDLVTDRLLALLQQHRLTATIAVADPVHSAATDAILSSDPSHEIAVLGDASWVGRGAGRERFGRELDRRFHSARAAGLTVSSLLLRQVDLSENFDLLTKHTITSIRTIANGSGVLHQPQRLRLGMWQMPVALTLPHKPNWFRSTVAAAWKLLKRTVQAKEVLHLAIDAGQLAESDTPKWCEIERIFALIAQLRDAGRLEVTTLQALALSLTRPGDAPAMHSVQRAA